VDNPNLAEGWVAVSGKATLRKDLGVLNNATDILNSPNLKAAGLDRDALQRIVEVQKNLDSAAPDFKELLENIVAAEKFADRPGFDKVLSSLQNTAAKGAPLIGANYTLKFLKEKGGNITAIKFEEKILDGARIVDMTGKVNGKDIFFEFKSVKDLPPGDFGKQFTNDLINSDSLEQIKWVFDSTKVDASKLAANKSSLLNQLEKSLETLSQRELEGMAFKYGVQKPTVAEITKVVSDNFEKIFGVF